MDPTTPPCLDSDDNRVPAEIQEANIMLGMYAQMVTGHRTRSGDKSAVDHLERLLRTLPEREERRMLIAAMLRLTGGVPS